jgi:MFS family permease
MPTSMNALRTHYRWIIVAAGGALGCVAIGGLFSLPVFLRPIAQDTGWSTTGISTAMTLAFVALALGSIGWGYLSDRVGPRIVVLAGSVLLASGLALASLATSLVAFQVLFGVVVGISAAAIFACSGPPADSAVSASSAACAASTMSTQLPAGSSRR